MKIEEFQRRIEAIYFERDSARGLAGTHMWFSEEVGELTRALRRGPTATSSRASSPTCFAWLSTHRLDERTWTSPPPSSKKYGDGCPRCKSTPCACP